MRYPNLELIDPTTPEGVADWIELTLVVNKIHFSKTKTKSSIEKSLGKETTDSFVEEVFSELNRRSCLYGEFKPFQIVNGLITPNIDWKKKPEYVLCLIFSVFGNYSNRGRDSKADGTLFERLTKEVAQGYLKGAATCFNYPKTKKIKDISKELCEPFIKEFPGKRQDRGLDVIAWKSFGDKRPSQIIILFQCSTGNDWRNKLLELYIPAWKKYIDFGEYVIKGFCLPRVISSNEEDYCEMAVDSGIIIDRTRIIRCLEDMKIDKEFKKELLDWCKKKLDYYNNL